MPELPEVETVRRQLTPAILDRAIERVEVLHDKITRDDPALPDKLTGEHFSDISRIGKLLIFHLEPSGAYLLCHLKMTGQLLFCDEGDLTGGGHTLTKSDLNLPNRHTRVIFHFTDGSQLFFNDMRLFGYFKTVDEETKQKIVDSYGIEPLTDNYTRENFEKALQNRKTTIKALLLNQTVISGLGNIYVDEACFLSGVRPERTVGKLSPSERDLLYKNCEHVIREALENKGTTFYSFTRSDGRKGNHSDHLQVFRREGQPCYTCGTPIIKTRVAGRGTHYCPTCQK